MESHQISTRKKQQLHGCKSLRLGSQSLKQIFTCLISVLSSDRLLLMRISELFFSGLYDGEKYVLHCIWTVCLSLKSLVFCLCFRGLQTMDLTVIEGGPLPFAFDILTTVFQYGNRVFAKYPKEIPDYFKQSFPEGYSWERSMTYEDGGICHATNNIT